MESTQMIHWRRKQRLSQRAAANLLGCSNKTIANYESGQSDIPRYIALAVAAIQFNLPPYGDS